jgi:hypothetical protein
MVHQGLGIEMIKGSQVQAYLLPYTARGCKKETIISEEPGQRIEFLHHGFVCPLGAANVASCI